MVLNVQVIPEIVLSTGSLWMILLSVVCSGPSSLPTFPGAPCSPIQECHPCLKQTNNHVMGSWVDGFGFCRHWSCIHLHFSLLGTLVSFPCSCSCRDKQSPFCCHALHLTSMGSCSLWTSEMFPLPLSYISKCRWTSEVNLESSHLVFSAFFFWLKVSAAVINLRSQKEFIAEKN